MATIGRVSAVFTASTAGLTAGVEAAGRAFRNLGGDASTLRASLATLQKSGSQSFADIGPAATAAKATFDSVAAAVVRLKGDFAEGKISGDQFRESMTALTSEAATMAAAVQRGAQVTRENINAQEQYDQKLSELNQLLALGTITQETFNRAQTAAAAALAQADGSAQAAAAAARELQATQQAGVAVTAAMQTAQERHAAQLAEYARLLNAGAISQETFNRAQAAADTALAQADGSAAAAAAATAALAAQQQRAAAVAASVMTAQEQYSASVAELNTLLAAGAISQETFDRAVAAATATLQQADGTTRAAAEAAAALAATQQRGAAVATEVMTAQERYSARLNELRDLLSAGAISQQTFDRAASQASITLAEADGTAAAARRALEELNATYQRGAAVTQSTRTAQERYAAEVDDLAGLLRAGAINQDTYNRAVAAARERMQGAGTAARQMDSGLSGIASRLNVLIGLEVGRLFASIASTISNSIGSLIRFAGAEAQVVEETAKLANRLGLTYGEMAGLKAAGDLVGVGMDQIGKAVTKADVALVKASGGSKVAQKAFADLGLNIDELANMNAADRFNAIAESIAALPTEAQRSAAAVQLFGRAGAELLPLFNEGADAIRQAREEAERFGLTLTGQQAKNVDTMNDSFDRARQAIAGVVQQVTAFLAPAVTGVVNQFNAFIANVGGANIGQAIGEGILTGAEYLAGIADWVVTNFNGAFAYLSQVGQQLGGVFDFLSRTVSFLSGVWNTAKTIMLTIVGAFSGAFQGLATIAQKIGQFLGFDTGTLDQLVAGAQAFNAEINRGITESANAAANDFSNAFRTDAAPVGQAVAGPFVTALRDARQQARDAANAVDEAKKAPVEITQQVEVAGIAQALKGVDSRSQEGVAEMFRIMRGDTGNVQEQMLGVLETIAENTSGDDLPAVELAGA